MKHPKKVVLIVGLLSVVAAVAVAAAFHLTHRPGTVVQSPSRSEASRVQPSRVPAAVGKPSAAGTPSDAARKRAQELNDAMSRFNAPGDQ